MSILIKNVLLDQVETDVYVEGNIIQQIKSNITRQADTIIDATGKAIIPGFVNMHTHAAMTLTRSYADDIDLFPWLNEHIWPFEAKLTDEDVYWGAKLACLEMIKTGTTCFLDMYQWIDTVAKAVDEMGIRAYLSMTCFDTEAAKAGFDWMKMIEESYANFQQFSDRVHFALGPHAIYTVSDKLLLQLNEFAQKHDLFINLHVSETEHENEECIKRTGKTPVQHLHELGLLSPRLILAHALHFDELDKQLIAENGVSVVHNPASNLKLASGYKFEYDEMKAMGIPVGLGTDGCGSSNNLDMIDAMKLAALVGKAWRKDPKAVTAPDIFKTATCDAAEILGLNAGLIEEGRLADFSLVDLNIPSLTPNHNLIANLVYSANGSCIDTVVCDGKILMQNRHVPGEELIMQKATEVTRRIMSKL